MKYKITAKIFSKTGGVRKPVDFSITLDADSREEARQRLKSACARLMNKEIGSALNEPGEECFMVDENGFGAGSTIITGGSVFTGSLWCGEPLPITVSADSIAGVTENKE